MSKINKILYYSQEDPSVPGGPNVNEYEFTKALHYKFGKKAWFAIPPSSNAVSHIPGSNRITIEKQPSPLCLHRLMLSSYRTASTLRATIREKEIDLVVIRMSAYPVVPWLLSRWIPEQVVLKTVGQYWAFEKPPHIIAALFNALNQYLYTSVIRNALAIDTVTPQFKARLDAITNKPNKVLHVNNATCIATFKPGLQVPVNGLDLTQHWPVLGYCGTHPSERGASQLIELARRLRPIYPDMAILVVGWDDNMNGLIETAKSHGVDDICHFVGMRPYQEVASYINMMDLCYALVPETIASVVGNSSQKIRQYLACGRPVISTPHGSDFLAEQDLGAQVKAEDIDHLEEQTMFWINRLKTESTTITANARAYAVDNLTMKSALSRRLAFWTDMMEESGL